MSYSQRKGFKPASKALQVDDLDEETRNALWSMLSMLVWDVWEAEPGAYAMRDRSRQAVHVENLITIIWVFHFKKPIDRVPDFTSAIKELRNLVMTGKFYDVLDLYEFIVDRLEWSKNVVDAFNVVMERESAGFRFVNKSIVDSIDDNTITSIQNAIDDASNAAAQHLTRALEHLSDRKNPDYANSIKESISALEATCQEVAGLKGATLNDCLKRLREKKHFHPALEKALAQLYGYTSDSGGIRHAATAEIEKPSQADAQFMLATCSAFINYSKGILASRSS